MFFWQKSRYCNGLRHLNKINQEVLAFLLQTLTTRVTIMSRKGIKSCDSAPHDLVESMLYETDFRFDERQVFSRETRNKENAFDNSDKPSNELWWIQATVQE
ncbi:hypothetical protein [Levilactobacillus sp. N40-8-2]|uniref:hypothetical protein n=1 Tax=Levilactobacillus muriae TaxID=3238987 RepID=UPI0038B37A13